MLDAERYPAGRRISETLPQSCAWAYAPHHRNSRFGIYAPIAGEVGMSLRLPRNDSRERSTIAIRPSVWDDNSAAGTADVGNCSCQQLFRRFNRASRARLLCR